jgi:ribokinase
MRAHVIGNVALDETISVAALPTPGASILGAPISRDLGGTGANQAIVLGRAGVSCRFGSVVGRDARATEIRACLAAEPIDTQLVELGGVASDFSILLMAEVGENAVVTTNAAAEALTLEAAVAMLAGSQVGDVLVLQGNLSGDTTRALLTSSRERGLTTVLNPSPLRDFLPGLWPLVDVVFLNEGEAAAVGGPANLLTRGPGHVVVTLGARGALLVSEKGSEEVPSCPAVVVDTTGAGDCFMATALASATLRGVDLDRRAIAHAAEAAALTVSRPGTVRAFPSGEELAAILAK